MIIDISSDDSYILVNPVLVNGPNGWYMGLDQSGQRHRLEICPGTYEPGLADPAVAHQDHLDQLLLVRVHGQHGAVLLLLLDRDITGH